MGLSILTLHGLLVFAGAELLFSLTPGPTVMLITAYGFRSGFRQALAANVGTQTGNTIWYLVCVAGLGALLTSSPLIFQLLKLAGAAYLVWLGGSEIWHSLRKTEAAHGPRLKGSPYVQALLTQLSNPKALLFFGALVPQFLDTHRPLLPQYGVLYAVTLIGESTILSGYGWLAAHGGRIAGTRHAALRERVSGTMLVALGVLAAIAAT